MKEYLKMADVFGLPLCRFIDDGSVGNVVDANGGSIIYIQQTTKLKTAESRNSVAEYATQAINSHDELVAINKELLAALELMLLIHDEPSGFCGKFGKELDMAIEGQKEKIDTRIAVARNAIAKAKGV